MNTKTTTTNRLSAVRVIADQFSVQDIEQCMGLALANKTNTCFTGKTTEEVMNVLAKASYIRMQMNEGMTLAQSMRELGRRIRSMQQVVSNNE